MILQKGDKVRQVSTGRLGTVTRRGMQRVRVSFVGGGEMLCPAATLEKVPDDTPMTFVRYKRSIQMDHDKE